MFSLSLKGRKCKTKYLTVNKIINPKFATLIKNTALIKCNLEMTLAEAEEIWKEICEGEYYVDHPRSTVEDLIVNYLKK